MAGEGAFGHRVTFDIGWNGVHRKADHANTRGQAAGLCWASGQPIELIDFDQVLAAKLDGGYRVTLVEFQFSCLVYHRDFCFKFQSACSRELFVRCQGAVTIW